MEGFEEILVSQVLAGPAHYGPTVMIRAVPGQNTRLYQVKTGYNHVITRFRALKILKTWVPGGSRGPGAAQGRVRDPSFQDFADPEPGDNLVITYFNLV